MLFIIMLYVKLQRNFPGETLLQFYLKGKVGKWFAKLFGCVLAFYFIINIALVARIMEISVDMFLLDRTPATILVGVFLLTTSYAVSKGVQGIVHINLMYTKFFTYCHLHFFYF